LASVDVNTGDYFLMNNTNLDFYTDLSHAAMSSGSIPAVFPPQNFKGRILMDGGTVWNVNIDSAIKWC
jgi:predicted acylesterase/phospholipase RssA